MHGIILSYPIHSYPILSIPILSYPIILSKFKYKKIIWNLKNLRKSATDVHPGAQGSHGWDFSTQITSQAHREKHMIHRMEWGRIWCS